MPFTIQTEFAKSELCNVFASRCQSDPELSGELHLVNEAAEYVNNRAKVIIRHMGEYTLHDIDHIYNVLRIMELLIGKENVHQLSTPELMLLILSALFHDIGMAPSENDVIAWKKYWDSTPALESQEEISQYELFKRHISARPDKIDQISNLIINGDHSKADLLKHSQLSDYIRITHSFRAKEIIASDWDGKIKYKGTDLTVELAEVCFSHNSDVNSILRMDKHYLCGQGEYVCLPLVAIILRIADLIDFDSKRTPDVLLSNLAIRNPISLAEWKKHRSIEAWEISPDIIQFHAKCRHPAIESAIHKFCDYIDKELIACNAILPEISRFQSLELASIKVKLPIKVDRSRIETKKDIHGNPEYLYRETKFNLSKNQVIDLLMGTKLYGNPEVALRELLQNSIDACLLRQAMEMNWNNPYFPEIHVKYFMEKNDICLEVIDNGIGMDQAVIDNYYTNIGKSFYKSTDFYDLRASTRAKFSPTSRFGIGILSCFMVADVLIVDTRKLYGPHSSSDPLNLTVEGQDSVFWIKPGQRESPGTTTRLILRKSKNPWERLTPSEFIKTVESVIPNPPFKIIIESLTEIKERDQASFKEKSAESLSDNDWTENDNIKKIEFRIDNNDFGIAGSVIVGILEKHGVPCDEIDNGSKSIQIEDNDYTLAKTTIMQTNEIESSAETITIDEDGNISQSSNTRTLAKSKSSISLHGIEIATSLFPEYWRKRTNGVEIKWPFPMLLVVDICGTRDLDLNSARDQILYGDKWLDFESTLSYLVCSNIKKEYTSENWQALLGILQKSKSPEFLRGLAKATQPIGNN